MLDADTKRRIDTARDILVGKVPDPKSQVEQITIALIYKFMDDIDAQSEEMGGKRAFFAGEFARYGWPKLARSGLGGYEMLNLYAEAITRMPENPGIPPLFRTIFSNAYLPYRDPETLRAFLRIIDEFTYDHSERLGDAFEYLLSVLGAQGDAGQFRTPRHIIDFIVSIVDPKKDEIVLDPACGTAGFLISSYNHIRDANTDAEGTVNLTPDERRRLADNFKGYDISPDMVRLSLVNLYLHGFTSPQIDEYDTLTSEEKWHEYADVILANPPFMSPKGGIRPHNRFSVPSRRSEVLFVDYIAEHLTAAGRAGVIVPEGVIFQSQRAHTALRKMLVDEYLVAVVSLPAGVFQPYSGVKTSILILDKAVVRRADGIAFFKVENDGYDLGAQRREIEANDLPAVQTDLTEYLRRLRAGEPLDDFEPATGLVVAKERIAEGGDYNLSGERYRENQRAMSSWPVVKVSDVFYRPNENVTPSSLSGPVTYVGLENISTNSGQLVGETVWDDPENIKSTKGVFHIGDILYGRLRPNLNKVWVADREGICSTDILVVRTSDTAAEPCLYGHIMRSQAFNAAVLGRVSGAQLPRISWQQFESLEIPLPPLEVQRALVAEIDGYQRVIDGARAVVENWRPRIAVDQEWPLVEIGDCCVVKGGKRLPKGEQLSALRTAHPYIRVSDFAERTVDSTHLKFVPNHVHERISRYTISSSDVYISIAGTIGLMGTIPEELDGANLTENAARLSFDKSLLDKQFLAAVGSGELVQRQISALTHAVGVPKLALERIKTIKIPLPPLATQQAIVAEIEAEQALVSANRELVERMEARIAAAIGRVWSGG